MKKKGKGKNNKDEGKNLRKGRLEDKRFSLWLMLMYKIVESWCLFYLLKIKF